LVDNTLLYLQALIVLSEYVSIEGLNPRQFIFIKQTNNRIFLKLLKIELLKLGQALKQVLVVIETNNSL
jgi:hypothetical protein